MRHSFNRLALASPAALILALCGQAQAQSPMGDGHALDANLSATQGKVNPQANGLQQQIRYNNAVINGTAANGASFRGSVGYRAPDQFGGSVGSDTLYNFQRDSYSNALAAAGVRGSDALRYQFALTTGQNVPGFMAAAPSGVARSGTVATGASSTALRSTSDFLTSQAFHPTLVGARLDDQGAEYLAKASPLLGVTWVKTSDAIIVPPAPGSLQPQNSGSLVPHDLQGSTVPGAQTPGAQAPAGTPANGLPAATPSGLPGTPQSAVPGAVNPYTGIESKAQARTIENPLDRTNPALDTRVQDQSSEPNMMVQSQLMTRFREGFNSQTTPSTKPPTPPTPQTPPQTPDNGAGSATPQSDSLQDQFDRLHRALNGVPEPTPDQKNPSATPGATSLPQPGGLRAVDKPVIPETSRSTPPGTPSARSAAKPLPANGDLNALTPEFMKGIKKLQEKKVEHFAEPAPGVGPDTSTDPEGYRTMMREGERLLADGHYFDAEDNFVRAIAGAPNDPMARAGRIHAEIGAGLYLSAAANLRALLAASPEIAALRYADRLLPGADRSQVIIEQLAKQEKSTDSSLGREASLLAAYMGYQRGDTKAVTGGLDAFAGRIAPDPSGDTDRALLEFLRKIWIPE